ncbi:unnamed protein product [Ostreobium quekettii]|uniref:Calcineurin-binding protein cabin-1 n=1 Tax=Ostreobium quekettii TaxID=121088 RepID=A0A8S1IRC6_9CHLO|nr:unnamed protein product [Ostreobium quekettii]
MQEEVAETPPHAQGDSSEKFGPSPAGSSQVSPIQSSFTNEDASQDAAQASASDSHARQRTSKRLAEREQKRGAEKETRDAALTRNVPAMLGPIFGHMGWGALVVNGSPESAKVECMAVDGGNAREASNSKEDVMAFLSSLEDENLWDVAVRLVRRRTMSADDLEDLEPAHLVQLDNLLQPMWKYPPLCALTMAELHLDHALQSANRSERIESTEVASCLRHCERNLLTCHKEFLLGVMPVQGNGHDLDEPEVIIRYHWCRAMLLECQQKFEEAAAHYRCCLAICNDDAFEPVVLRHWKRENRIDAVAVQKKLDYAKLLGQLCDMESWKQEGRAQELIDALSPLVLAAEGATTKGRMLNRVDKIKALQLLQDAAATLRPTAIGTEMMADIVLLELLLPKLSLREDTINDHYGAAHGKVPPALAMACRKPPKNNKAIMMAMKKLLSLGEAVLQHAALPDNSIFQCFEDGDNLKLMRTVRLRVLQHLEWCYWRFQSQVKRGQDAVQLMSQRCNALCEAARAMVVFHQIDPDAGSDPQATEDLLCTLFRLLADREALLHQQGSVLKLFLMCLRAATMRKMAEYGLQPGSSTGNFPQGSPFSINSNISSEVTDDLLDALGDGIAQCLRCLYGVELGLGNHQWGGGYSSAAKDRLVMNSRDACLEVWRAVQPYLEIIASKDPKKNYKKFNACKDFLCKISKHVASEPPEAVAALRVDAFLDDPNIDEKSLLNGDLPDFLNPQSAQRMEILQNVADREVHNHLHYWSALSTVEESMDYNICTGALGENADEKIEEQVQWVKWDLVFNPTRCWSWETLGMCYKDASETLWDNAAIEVQPGAWPQHEAWIRRLERLQRWQLRCLAIARALGAKDSSVSDSDVAELDEALGEAVFNVLQCVPPQHHGKKRAIEFDAESQAKCRFALKRYMEAANVLSEEWTFMLYVGKLTWKLKEEGWENKSMDIFAQTAMFATVHGGGLVEPIYRLHATRLKLLLAGNRDWGMLTRYMFNPDTDLQTQVDKRQQAVATGGSSTESLGPLDEYLFQGVFSDCAAAMLFCFEENKYHHRALHRLADAYYRQGDLSRADGYLRQLFSRGKKSPAFFINVWMIETENYGMKRATTKRSTRTANQVCRLRPGSQGASCASIPRSLWGQRPAGVDGKIGVIDSRRKYVAALRKYIGLYLKILYRTGDLETLKSAVACLKAVGGSGGAQALKTASGTCPCLNDIAPLALGYFLILLVQKLRVLLPHPPDTPEFKPDRAAPLKEHQKSLPTCGASTPGSSPERIEHRDNGSAAPAPLRKSEEAGDICEVSRNPARMCSPGEAMPTEKDGEEEPADVCIPQEACSLLEQTYNMYFVRVCEGKSDLSWTVALQAAFEEVSQLPEPVQLTQEEVLHDLTAYAHSYPCCLRQNQDIKRLDALAGGFRKRPMAQRTKLGSAPRYRALAHTLASNALATLKALAERLAPGTPQALQAGSHNDPSGELRQLIQLAADLHRHLSGELKPKQLAGLEGIMQHLYSQWCQTTGQSINLVPPGPGAFAREPNVVRLCEAVLKLPPPKPVAAESKQDVTPPSAAALGPSGPDIGLFAAGMGSRDALQFSSAPAGGEVAPGMAESVGVEPASQRCMQEVGSFEPPPTVQQQAQGAAICQAPSAAQECIGAAEMHSLSLGTASSQEMRVAPTAMSPQLNAWGDVGNNESGSREANHVVAGADPEDMRLQQRADKQQSTSGLTNKNAVGDFDAKLAVLRGNSTSSSVDVRLDAADQMRTATEQGAKAHNVMDMNICGGGTAAGRQSSEWTGPPRVESQGAVASNVSAASGHIVQAISQILVVGKKGTLGSEAGVDGHLSQQSASVLVAQEQEIASESERDVSGPARALGDNGHPADAKLGEVGTAKGSVESRADVSSPNKESGAFSAAFSQCMKKSWG